MLKAVFEIGKAQRTTQDALEIYYSVGKSFRSCKVIEITVKLKRLNDKLVLEPVESNIVDFSIDNNAERYLYTDKAIERPKSNPTKLIAKNKIREAETLSAAKMMMDFVRKALNLEEENASHLV